MDSNCCTERDHIVRDVESRPVNLATCSVQSSQTNPPMDLDRLSSSSPIQSTAGKLTTEKERKDRLAKLSGAVKTILTCVGEDSDREGLRNTPERYAQALLFFTRGYEQDLHTIINSAIFHEDHDEIVIVKDIQFFSLCEHHLVPFFGKMHIGYIPNGKVIGLSKIAGIIEMYARRLQIQERLTKDVGTALDEILRPQGIAIAVEASHMCMMMRGVQKTGASTTTMCMRGCFRSSAEMREEFLHLIR